MVHRESNMAVVFRIRMMVVPLEHFDISVDRRPNVCELIKEMEAKISLRSRFFFENYKRRLETDKRILQQYIQ